MLLLIALTACLAVIFGVLALARRPDSPLQMRLQVLSGGSSAGEQEQGPVAGQAFLRTTRRTVEAARGILPNRWFARLEHMLTAAGRPVDAGTFLLVWSLLTGGASVLGALLLGGHGLVLGLLIGVLQYLWLRRKVRTRQRRISRDLPDAIDLLVACVEAGLGLDASLVRVSDATTGPLADEIRLTTGEMAVGRSRQEALLDLGTRTGVPELDGFLRPIIQAERAGSGVGSALRVQAAALRERRRQRAREKAEKVPAKMTVPMVVFFLPAIMLIAIAPAVFTLQKVFAGL